MEGIIMFSNIGGKIKGFAKFLCWFGIILSVVRGIQDIFSAADYDPFSAASVISGLIAMCIGAVCSWLASLVLYGFGQLVENSDDIKRRLYSKY